MHLVIDIVQRELGFQAGVSDSSVALMQRELSRCCSQSKDVHDSKQGLALLGSPDNERSWGQKGV